jgi:hypothetical protein
MSMSFTTAAQLLGDDIWIAVKLPGSYEGDDDLTTTWSR